MPRTTRPISSPAAPLRATGEEAPYAEDPQLTATRDRPPTAAELVRQYWWVTLLGGLVATLAGIFVLANPGRTIALVSIALGAYLSFWGTMHLIEGMETRHEEGGPLLAVLGLLGIVAGVLVVTRPVRGVTVVGLVFGVYLLVSAASAFVTALSGEADRSLDVLRGLADVVAGVIVVSWPAIGLLSLALILGSYLVARGILDVSGSLALRRRPVVGLGSPPSSAS